MVAFQGTGDLGHLHQAEHALLHAGAAGGTHDQHRVAAGSGGFDQAGELLAHHRAHRAAHEAEVHHPQGQGQAASAAEAGDDGIEQTGALLAVPQPIGVAAPILEGQRIGGGQGAI